MKRLLGLAALAALLAPVPALAALGGDTASIEADRARLDGTTQIKQAATFHIHEITARNGATVREFVSPNGNVFGVAWKGQFAPDMQQLLGPYFEQYEAAVKAQKASYVGRRPLNLQLPGLVVQMTGHMRALHGRAYLPQQLPQAMKAEDVW